MTTSLVTNTLALTTILVNSFYRRIFYNLPALRKEIELPPHIFTWIFLDTVKKKLPTVRYCGQP